VPADQSVFVARPDADPAIADLVIMHARIVDGGRQLENLWRQPNGRSGMARRRLVLHPLVFERGASSALGNGLFRERTWSKQREIDR
jgi:hypothetical protein